MFRPITPLDPQRRASLEAELNRAAQACPVLRYGDAALRPLLHERGLPHAATGGADLWPRFACYYEQLTHLPRRTRRSLQRQWRRSLAAIALLLALGQAPALAATIDVDGTTCTLVDAITAANTDTAVDGCTAGSGADVIELTGEVELTSVDNDTDGPNGLPSVTSTITLNSGGHTLQRSTVTGTPVFRLLHVADTGQLTLNQITLANGSSALLASTDAGGAVFNRGTVLINDSTVSGNTANFGGGVYNDGTLTLSNSTVSGNAAFVGGGVFNSGTLTLTNSTVSGNSASSGAGIDSGNSGFAYNATLTLTGSTVSGNSASGGGGGVRIYGGTVTLTNSTVSGNTGGGVLNAGGTLTLTNSTVSGNSAAYSGGGVLNAGGTLTLTNSTVSGNSAGEGGGVYNGGDYRYGTFFGGYLTLTRSVISGNTAANGAETQNFTGPQYSSPVHANNFNLFGVNGDAGVVGFTPGGTDIIPAARLTLADILAPLADNGGPTQTHALIAGSPAIDAAGLGCPPPATDQRGVARPQGAACDIGSFEIMDAPAPDLAVSKSDSPDPVVVTDHLRYTVTVNNAGQGAATGVILTDTLPASVDFVSVRPRDVCAESGGVVTCELGTLASGEKASVKIVVIPTAPGRITNRVTVTSAETDENPENNTDREKTTVNKLLCHGRVPTLVGTPGNNTLTGTSGPDVIHGLSGHDTISGRGGKDVLCGGEGKDTLFGENGNDKLFGENDKDTLKGGRGRDALDGGAGTDTCHGGSGSDTGTHCETETSIP